MRDDIHKSAPVNRAWKQYLKHVARKADRDALARESAERALTGDCRREFSGKVLQDLVERCASPSPDLFRSKLDGLESREGHVMEQQLIGRLRLAEQTGTLDSDTLDRELTGVITARAENQGRAMKGHILKEGGGGKDAADCIRAINAQIASLPAANIAKELVANPGGLKTGAAARPVNLDENIR